MTAIAVVERQSVKSRTVNTVLEITEELIECYSISEQSNSSSAGNGAAGIKRMLNDPNFLFWFRFFSRIMHVLHFVWTAAD